MGFGLSAPSPMIRFGYRVPLQVVDCCIFNIFTIKSISREMRGWSVGTVTIDLPEHSIPISLALSGHYDRSTPSMQRAQAGQPAEGYAQQDIREDDGICQGPSAASGLSYKAIGEHRSQYIT